MALTFWNEHCGFCGVTNMQFQYLKPKQAKFYSNFLLSADTSPGPAVCVAPSALLYARRRHKAVDLCAIQRSLMYPASVFLQRVKAGRAKQRLQIDTFADKVTKRLSLQSDFQFSVGPTVCIYTTNIPTR